MALQSEMFLAVYLGGFLLVCKVTSQAESPATCPVVWEVGCLGDRMDPALNFHQTRVQGLDLCQGLLIRPIPLTKAILHFNSLDRRACPRRLEWDIQAQRRHSRCWPSRTDRWKHSKGGTLKRGNRERGVA